MKIAVTCIQLLRDLGDWQDVLASHGFDVHPAEVPGQYLAGAELVAALEGCVGVIAGDDAFTEDVLSALPDLRVISKWGSGIDGIDLDAAQAHGITVTNTPGMFDDEVADVTMAYVTILARELVAISNSVVDGGWFKPAGTSLKDSTLGIIGLGGIGRAVARRALVAGMTVLGYDPSDDSIRRATELGVSACGLADLLRESDFISVNCPLTPDTFHLLDDAALATTRSGVRIVNTGRGAVVDTDALVRALASGHVAAAALDVLEEEPPSPGNPLLALPNVVFGSHNASNTYEASARVHQAAIDNLVGALGAPSK